MNEDNNFGAPNLDDIDYSSPAQKNSGPVGVSAPVLDDIEYVAPAAKKGDPTGVSAPVLDDMDDYTPSYGAKKGAPTGVTAPVLDDDSYSYTAPNPKPEPQILIMSDEDIINGLTPELKIAFDKLPADKQQQIIEMRRTQLGAQAPPPVISAPVLDEDNYTPPPKKEERPQPVSELKAPVLDDEPAPAKYVPKFVDEDLERAKKEGAKKAVSASLVSEQKDSKESLRMMLELKEQQRAELAKKGQKLTLIVALLGLVATAAFYLLYSGSLGLDYKGGMTGISHTMSESALYIAMAMGISGLTLITGFGFFKSIASLIYVLSAIAQLFPGAPMIPQHEGSMGLVCVLYAVSLICTIGVIVMLSASEAVGLYFKK